MMPRARLLVGLAALLAPLAVRGDAFVTACGSDVAPGGVNLAQALAGGGTIYIQCPSSQPIRITRQYVIRVNTVLHGNGNAVLDGTGLNGTFLYAAADVLQLKALTMRNFNRGPPASPAPGAVSLGRFGGSVVTAQHRLGLENVRTENSTGPYVGRGDVSVVHSQFVGNRGVALVADGGLDLADSVFDGNQLGLMFSAGRVRGTRFINHTDGAVSILYPKGPVVIRGSWLNGTAGGPALRVSQRAAPGGGEVLVRATTFANNAAGALQVYARQVAVPLARPLRDALPPAAFRLEYDHFVDNRAPAAGAALDLDLANTRGLRVVAGHFARNSAGARGGAVFASGGPLRIEHSIFQDNRAPEGAAVFAMPDAPVVLANTLAVGHPGAGAVVQVGHAQLVNVTIADNAGLGLYATTPKVAIRNSILANNRQGSCRGLSAAAAPANNLQFGPGTDCPGMPAGDPYLDRMYAPMAGSPALAMGDAALCREDPVNGRDLAFQLRAPGSACALGAYEEAPLRKVRRPRRDIAPPQLPTRVPEQLDGVRAGGSGALPIPPATAVLAALEAEVRTSSRAVDLVFQLGDKVQAQRLERVGADRLRYLSSAAVGMFEAIRVGSMTRWRRDLGPWQAAPTPPLAANAALYSAGEIFRSGFTNASDVGTRTRDGRAERVLSGALTWSNGGVTSAGTLVMAIDTGNGLPTEMLFKGSCGKLACRFYQRFDYAPLRIELPPLQ
jgi:hypothetical protein